MSASRGQPLVGLAPIERPTSRVLVLGSMPGDRSLTMRQYYANPGNRFWRVAATLLEFDPAAPYSARVEALRRRHVALWDVLATCRRHGSLDSAIEKGSEVSNDFTTFLRTHPGLIAIGLNGGAAARIFRATVLPTLESAYTVVDLPSTSGANASWSIERLLGPWGALLALAS